MRECAVVLCLRSTKWRVQKDEVFRIVAWQRQKSPRPVRSTGTSAILAYGEAIVEGKIMARAMSLLLDADVPLVVSLDSKDLFESLSTQREIFNKSICVDVELICYEYEMDGVRTFLWTPGRKNLADR